jgi:DNA-binding NarL/FixJ family response regulator
MDALPLFWNKEIVMRVIIVDDHPLICLGIRSLFSQHRRFEIVGEAHTRREGLELIERCSPDLAIIDMILGNDDGLNFVKECRSSHTDLSVIVFTMRREDSYAERVIRAGAHGFVAKSKGPEELLQAVEAVSRGELYLSRTTASRLLGKALKDHRSPPQDPVERLSDRELHVFQMIGSTFSTREIADSLGLSRKTIETYKENIKAKLGLPNAKELKLHATAWVDQGSFQRPGELNPQGPSSA